MLLNELRRLIQEAFTKAYDILGVSPNASSEEIKSAWRKMSIKFHPDRNRDRDTTEDMKKINVAYSLLSDPVRRRDYDIRGDNTLEPHHVQPSRRKEQTRDYGPPPQPKSTNVRKASYVYEGPSSNVGGYSSKFWTVELKFPKQGSALYAVVVQWGKLHDRGQEKTYLFPSEGKALTFIHRQSLSKIAKGYKRMPPDWERPSRSKGEPQANKKQSSPKAAKTSASKKDTYKIYGKKAGQPVHTRVKGKVYVPTGQTKFVPGNAARISINNDKAKVSAVDGDWTQTWSPTDENVASLIDRLVLENIVKSAFV